MRGRRLPPHHLLPRPAGRAGGLHDPDRGGPRRGAGAARQRQPRREPATSPGPAGTSPSGTIRTRSPPTCSPWSAAGSARSRSRFTTMAGGRAVELAVYVEPGKEDRAGLRPRRARALHALGRDASSAATTTSTCSTSSPCPTSTWAPWRTRASTSSTTSTCWRAPRPRPTATTPASRRSSPTSISTTGPATAITCRDWFQLCLKEGLTVFRDQEFSSDERSRAGAPDRRGADAAGAAVPARMRAPSPTRCGRAPTARSTTSTRRPSTRRAPRSSGCCARCSAPDAFRGRHGPLFRRPATARPRPSRTSSPPSRRCRAATSRLRPLVRAGRHAAPRRSSDGVRSGCGPLHPAVSRQSLPGAGGRDRPPLVMPVALGLVGADGTALAARPARHVRDGVFVLDRDRGRDRLRRRRRGPVPSLLRGFSAPGAAWTRADRRRAPAPARARQRPVQPLAGGAGRGPAR